VKVLSLQLNNNFCGTIAGHFLLLWCTLSTIS